MREIKFRIKFKENDTCLGGWEYFTIPDGFIVRTKENENNYFWETLTQFTDLKDKNGIDIYEGDILGNSKNRSNSDYVVKYFDGAFWLRLVRSMAGGIAMYLRCQSLEIIGNIYDNPDLLNK